MYAFGKYNYVATLLLTSLLNKLVGKWKPMITFDTAYR